MAGNQSSQQLFVELNALYDRAEKDIQTEISKKKNAHQKVEAELNILKGKYEVLTHLQTFSEDSKELQTFRNDIFRKIVEQQFLLRLKREKEILLYGFILKINHMQDITMPTVVELNCEYRVRKQKIFCELVSGFLAEERGYEKYHDFISDANNELDRAIDLGDIDVLTEAINLYKRIFADVLNDEKISSANKEKFDAYSKFITKLIEKTPPITCDEVLSREAIQTAYMKVKMERQKQDSLVEKFYYQFHMLYSMKQPHMIEAELRKIRSELETLVFKEYNLQRDIIQLTDDVLALIAQKKQFCEKPNIHNYEEAMTNFTLIEKRFKRVLSEAKFSKPSFIEKFFTVEKGSLERSYIKEEQSNFQHVLQQILNNDNISIHQKRDLVRLSRESVLVNTHTGKFFFQRAGKTGTRLMLDELESNFNTTVDNLMPH